ncbi:MlaE family ABC transporter permease [Desulfohalovibrio reitneri]|uniref:MlaE family ABC transporter permease n=1 Tax=Desulfohalovibrio reitneri TaxID=1307759 RepID=UPI0004A6B015|nr:ABC transporter permease [Desulfohalovibrio reitneri]
MAEYGSGAAAPLAWLGGRSISVLREMGRYALFAGKSLAYVFKPPFQFFKIIEQVYFVGVRSLTVILLIALFTGMVLGLQGYYTLIKFGTEGLLGAAVALSLIRELGPVLTAIMVIGRAGSAMSAEIGIMRISEQIDALDTMDIDPIRFLVSPKVAGSIIAFPLLTALFDVVGIIGGWLTGVAMLGVNSGIYFHRIESSVGMMDVTGGFIKSLIFALVVATMCCYQGYTTHLRSRGFGAVGVSLSTTTAVVLSCILVLVTDYVVTTFFM